MSASGLRLKRITESEGRCRSSGSWTAPHAGSSFLDVAVGETAPGAPFHWRAGDWRKPPVDVRLSHEGAVESIQFVLQDESVDVDDVIPPPDIATGLPKFDVAAWPSDRYSDVRVPITTGGSRPASCMRP